MIEFVQPLFVCPSYLMCLTCIDVVILAGIVISRTVNVIRITSL